MKQIGGRVRVSTGGCRAEEIVDNRTYDGAHQKAKYGVSDSIIEHLCKRNQKNIRNSSERPKGRQVVDEALREAILLGQGYLLKVSGRGGVLVREAMHGGLVIEHYFFELDFELFEILLL